MYDVAQRTRQPYVETGALFTRIAMASETTKTSSQDALDIAETVNKALVLGGASAMEARSTLLQLSQALASGVLQGEELRALRESAPVLLREIAAYYGVTIGALKEMGRAGELTAEGVAKAIIKAKGKIDKQFGKMPVTIEQAVSVALNRIGSFIFKINQETGIFQTIAKGIVKSVDGIISGIERAVKFVGGFTKAVKLLIVSLVALKIAMFVFAYPVTWLPRLIIYVIRLRTAILLTSRSLWALALNPVFWKAALIAAGIALIALALEDVYYWVTGGDSVLGDWLGTWEEFSNKVVNGIMVQWALALEYVQKILAGDIPGAIEILKQYWENFGNFVIGILSNIGTAIGDFLISKLDMVTAKLAEITGFGGLATNIGGIGNLAVKAESMVSGLSGGVSNFINQYIDINQAISTNQPVPQAVGSATAAAGRDAAEQFTRGINNVVYGDN